MSGKSANPIPQGKYIPANRYEKIIYTAGMTPRIDGKLMLEGKVSANHPLDYYLIISSDIKIIKNKYPFNNL